VPPQRKESDDGEIIGCDNSSINERALLTCMHYCICQLQTNQKELKKEILQEIRKAKGISDKKPDAKRIAEKMENMNDKKHKVIDLMLDGLITKADLQEQTKWYDEQLAELTEQLAELTEQRTDLRKKDSAKAKQTDKFEPYINALDEIMTFDETNESLYREILDKMVIYNDNTVEVWLKCVPFGIKLTLHSHGKNEDYTTDILNMELIERT
jgi:hypothetical protein